MRCLLLFIIYFSSSVNAQEYSGSIYVLGVAQDGGYPHAGCSKKCCADKWKKNVASAYVVSLAITDSVNKKWWLMEATPDIKYQLEYFQTLTHGYYNYLPDGIILTHAHIGHYSGLMQLSREVMNTHNIPVYVLSRMKVFLSQNAPWSQLVSLGNIELKELPTDISYTLTDHVKVEAFAVPHRDEFSETAGFGIITPEKKYLFIPDIDKWQKWKTDITLKVKEYDVSFLDATFNSEDELSNRKMSEVPHPFVPETMQLFEKSNAKEKSKIYFIHFNHTNPLLYDLNAKNEVLNKGFHIAKQGMKY